ncbi:Cj0814 family flagellar-dependent secreted protein [Helicobacter ganmani]|uniref:Cj0814 family flagellar-dependent secreted protein n=1 Tax=Helicobacter ganmani TaxID=60246 RepID=UPI003A86955D
MIISQTRNYDNFMQDNKALQQTSNANQIANQKHNLTSNKTEAVKEVLGYGVDSEGFFTSDLNEAAGIPKDYKIYAKDIENFVNYHQNRSDILATHNQVDIAKSLANAYKAFSQLIPQSQSPSFSNKELENMPYAFKMDSNYNVTQTYTYAEYQSALNKDESGILLTFNTFDSRGFSKINAETIFNQADNVSINKYAYQNANGIAKGGVLIAFLNNSSLFFNVNQFLEGETKILGKIIGLDKNISEKELENFKGFMNANKIQSAFGENNDSWNTIEEQLSLQYYIKRSEATGDKDLFKESLSFAQEYQEMIDSSMSLEEFKEKYLDFKERHEEFVKKLKEKENILSQSEKQNSNEETELGSKNKKFKPIQVTSKSETYQDTSFLNTLDFIKSQQKLEQILILFRERSKGSLDIQGLKGYFATSQKRLDTEA